MHGLLFEMSNKIVWPNVVTCSVIVEGLGKEANFEEDMKLFHEMSNKKHLP